MRTKRALLGVILLLGILWPSTAEAESWVAITHRWYIQGPVQGWEVAVDHHADGIFVVNAFGSGSGHQLHMRMHDWACISLEQDSISPLIVVRSSNSNRGSCSDPKWTGGGALYVSAVNGQFVGYEYDSRDGTPCTRCRTYTTAGPSGNYAYGYYAPQVDSTAWRLN